MLTTANSVGSFSRLITLCTSTMKREAITTGSMVDCGVAPPDITVRAQGGQNQRTRSVRWCAHHSHIRTVVAGTAQGRLCPPYGQRLVFCSRTLKQF
jgi:hypothetical protein